MWQLEARVPRSVKGERYQGARHWNVELLGDDNEFDSLCEALDEIPALKALGAPWSVCLYRAVLCDESEREDLEVPADLEVGGGLVGGAQVVDAEFVDFHAVDAQAVDAQAVDAQAVGACELAVGVPPVLRLAQPCAPDGKAARRGQQGPPPTAGPAMGTEPAPKAQTVKTVVEPAAPDFAWPEDMSQSGNPDFYRTATPGEVRAVQLMRAQCRENEEG